jgi:trimeric autotransporter adhesin
VKPLLFFALVAAAVVLVPAASATPPSSTPIASFPITDGIVNTMAVSGSTLYIGGTFSWVGPDTGSFAQVDTTTGDPSAVIPPTNGSVDVVISDRAGGWYIGGSFDRIGTTFHRNLAHITSAGAVDPSFDPVGPSGGCCPRALALSSDGNTLYVGGTFEGIGGMSSRFYLAALNTSDGTATSWDPHPSGVVNALALSSDDSTLYVGGSFFQFGLCSSSCTARNSLAAFDTGTGNLTSFDPNVTNSSNGGTVWALALAGDNSTLYAGGFFDTVNGSITRNHIAAFDTSNGNTTAWDPNASAQVRALALTGDGSTLYAGGYFTNIGGFSRNHIAALDTTTFSNMATGFDPNADDVVLGFALSGDESTLYTAGSFTNIGGAARKGVAALDTTGTGTATSFDPKASGGASSLALSGSQLGVGGGFRSLGAVSRSRLAAIDLTTNEVTSFDPNPNSSVSALTLSGSGSTLYVGGGFSTIGGQPRTALAALDTSTGNATSFAPSLNGNVNRMLLSGSTLFVGGSFSSIGGQPRNRIGAVNTNTGNATGFNPSPTQSPGSVAINAFAISGSTLYVGGNFNSMAGQGRNRLAAFNTSTNSLTSFNPNANGAVNALALSGTTLYVGGGFTTFNGGVDARHRLAAFDTSTGNLTAFDPDVALGTPNALKLVGTTLYVGGSIVSIAGQTRLRLAALDTTQNTNNATAFDPSVDSSGGTNVVALAASSSAVYAGGFFASIGNEIRGSLAAFTIPPPTVSFTATPDAASYSTSAHFEFESDVSGSTFQCRLDGAAFSTCSSPQDFAGLALGAHTFAVRATSGGLMGSPTTFAWTIVSPDGSGTLAASTNAVSAGQTGRTITFTYTAAAGGMVNGALTIDVPGDWAAPTSTTGQEGYTTTSLGSLSYVGNKIVVSGLTRSAGQKVTITYGSKAGPSPGATAPATPNPEAWPAQEKSTASVTLTDLGALTVITVYAADGSGQITPSPAAVSAGSTGQTIVLTYMAASGGMSNGSVRVSVPSGWTAPVTTTSANGYTSASTGTVATSGQRITVSGVTLNGGDTLTITYGDQSLGGSGATVSSTPGMQTWVSGERSTAGGMDTNLSPQPSVTVASADGSGTMKPSPSFVRAGSNGNTVTFTYTAAAGGLSGGAVTVQLPSGWSSASETGSDPGYTTASTGSLSASGGSISVTGVSLAAGQKLTIVYGSKTSFGPGATAPSSGSAAPWFTQERSSPAGTLVNVSPQPVVTVLSPDGSGTMSPSAATATSSSTNNTIIFTYTADTGGLVNGTVRLTVPSGWSVPSTNGLDPGYSTATTGTVSLNGRKIVVTGVTLTGGATLNIVYGASIGATAPSATGAQTWLTEEKSSAMGTLAPIAVQPSITVT